MNILTKLLSLFKLNKSQSMKSIDHSSKLDVADSLKDFLENEVLVGLDIAPEQFWKSFENVVNNFAPRNKSLLEEREEIQSLIDTWHIERNGKEFDSNEYKLFLEDIGYLAPRSSKFSITTANVDSEIKTIAGPQLVVPVMNARFALNAANARWGSLYDALYGTDMICEEDGAKREGGYNPIRGDKVIAFAKKFLDETIPLENGSFNDVIGFEYADLNILAILVGGNKVKLKDESKYVGYSDNGNGAYSLLFKNNNLHFEIQIDNTHPIGQTDKAGIKDIYMESAITTIQDCEDSVAAVDGEDKTSVYRNWLGLMKGDLKESFNKNGSEITRQLESDRSYKSKDGDELILPGRSLMLVRNVGHLMTNPGIKDSNGNEVPEGIIDAMFTICIAMHDLNRNGKYQNSKTGSIYIVKPKMHGPEEVQFTCDLFSAVERN